MCLKPVHRITIMYINSIKIRQKYNNDNIYLTSLEVEEEF